MAALGGAAGLSAATQAHFAALLGAEAQPIAVAIDWRLPQTTQVRPVATAQSAGWQDRFVNHLGAPPERLNPNAALRLHLPSGSSLTPKLSAL